MASSDYVLELWLHGMGTEGGGCVWEPWLRSSHNRKLQLGFVSHMCLPVGKSLKTSESWEVLEEEISRRLGGYQVPDLVLLGEEEKNQHSD